MFFRKQPTPSQLHKSPSNSSSESLDTDLGMLRAELEIAYFENTNKDQQITRSNSEIAQQKKTISEQAARIFELQQQLDSEKQNKTLEYLILLILALIAIGIAQIIYAIN